MKNLLIAFLVFVIAACGILSSDEPEPEFEPYTVGTWEIVSPMEAEWIGKHSSKIKPLTMSESDTLYLDSPGERGLSIAEENADPSWPMNLTMVDSTLNKDNYSMGDIRRNFKRGTPIGFGGISGSLEGDHIKITFDLSYNCDFSEPVTDADTLGIVLINGETQDTLVYNYEVTGIADAASDLNCS